MEEIKLTKEEFITRAMAGERFNYFSNIFYYDGKEDIPFRIDNKPLIDNWGLFDGTRKFLVLESKPSTIIVKEWLVYNYVGERVWSIYPILISDEDILNEMEHNYISKYKPTGREWEVEE